MTPREARQPGPAPRAERVETGPAGETSSAPPAAPSPAPTPSPPSNGVAGGLSLATIVDLWSKIRADVKAVNRRIEALLQQVDPAAVNGSQVVLVSPYEFHRNRVNTDEVRQVVESVIARLVGEKVQVTCLPREDAMKMAATARSNDATREDVPVEPPMPQRPEPAESLPGQTLNRAPTVDVADAEGAPEDRRKDDEARLTAARNIFDAEVVTD